MGVSLSQLQYYYEYPPKDNAKEQSKKVLNLATKVLDPIIKNGLPTDISHVVFACTCPDSLAPSLGQSVVEYYHSALHQCHVYDLVQGCAGGVSAIILASQLASLHQSSVLVVQADAAQKASSKKREISKIFGDGAFACIVSFDESEQRLIHTQSRQYKNLSEVVQVKLGHDADIIIQSNIESMIEDPRFLLGLSMENGLALRLIRNAEQFYIDFVANAEKPDVMILHQVNPIILAHLKTVFEPYDLEFIDVSKKTGNCGAASVGIALGLNQELVKGKKVMLCSFGTGGVITAGMWQM